MQMQGIRVVPGSQERVPAAYQQPSRALVRHAYVYDARLDGQDRQER